MKSLKSIVRPYKQQLENTNYNKEESYDSYLIEKWKGRIPKGWYGFDGIPKIWGLIIDKFLEELEKECPNFEIHQIKLKYGSLRFYVQSNIQDKNKIKQIEKQIDKLENLLQHESLVY